MNGLWNDNQKCVITSELVVVKRLAFMLFHLGIETLWGGHVKFCLFLVWHRVEQDYMSFLVNE